MTEGKREKGAVWAKLEERLQLLQEASEKRDLVGLGYNLVAVQVWEDILKANDVVKAVREKILKDVEFWLQYVREAIKEGEIGEAMNCLRPALKVLTHYAELLGVEIPPEEAAPVAPSAATILVGGEGEEAKPVEGTPLKELGLPTKVYNTLTRPINLKAAGMDKPPSVGELVKILERGDEGEAILLRIGNFGPKSLAELKRKLEEWKRGFLSAEEIEAKQKALRELIEDCENFPRFA